MQKIKKLFYIFFSRGFFITLLVVLRLIKINFQYFVLNKKLYLTNIYNFRMYLDINDKVLSRSLMLFGSRELDHKYLLEKIINKKMKIFDIGANIGYYSLLEKQLLENSENILCIEPIEKNINLLKKNLKLNRSNAFVLHGGVSNINTVKEIYVAHHSNLSSFHKNFNKKSIYTENKIKVPTYSIQKLISDFFIPDIIRMDVEGHEVEIFESLVSSIKENNKIQPLIIFETHFWRYQEDDRFKLILRKLFNLGYRTKYIASSDKFGTNKINFNGYIPIKSIKTDGVERQIYKDIKNEDLEYFLIQVGGVRTVVLKK